MNLSFLAICEAKHNARRITLRIKLPVSFRLLFLSFAETLDAETMHQEALALDEKVLGKEHSHMLTSMGNVAQG